MFAIVPLSGCLISSSHPVPHISTNKVEDATLEQLVATINSDAARLQTFIASVDIHFATGGKKKGQVTDYTDFGGHVLLRKPETMRMIVNAPVVGTKVVDMVTNGKTFEVSLPTKNQFLIGSNQLVGKPSDNAIENLRPQIVTDALLLQPIDPENEIAVLEQSSEMVKDLKTHKDAEQPDYVVIVLTKDPAGAYLSRKIVFSREDLRPHAQYMYDRQGQLVTFARYENVTDHDGVMFPGAIDIQRPVEEYSFRLTVITLRLNETIQDAQFDLPQPPGSKLVNLDNKNTSADTRTELKQDLAKSPQSPR
jgi:outer membrane lipoprotein-sorting protein